MAHLQLHERVVHERAPPRLPARSSRPRRAGGRDAVVGERAERIAPSRPRVGRERRRWPCAAAYASGDRRTPSSSRSLRGSYQKFFTNIAPRMQYCAPYVNAALSARYAPSDGA